MITSKWSIWKQVTSPASACHISYSTWHPVQFAVPAWSPCLSKCPHGRTSSYTGHCPYKACLALLNLLAAHSHWHSCCLNLGATGPAPEVYNLKQHFLRLPMKATNHIALAIQGPGHQRTPDSSMITWQWLYILWNTIVSSLLQINSGH